MKTVDISVYLVEINFNLMLKINTALVIKTAVSVALNSISLSLD